MRDCKKFVDILFFTAFLQSPLFFKVSLEFFNFLKDMPLFIHNFHIIHISGALRPYPAMLYPFRHFVYIFSETAML